jgi:hypothetical protein
MQMIHVISLGAVSHALGRLQSQIFAITLGKRRAESKRVITQQTAQPPSSMSETRCANQSAGNGRGRVVYVGKPSIHVAR